MLSDLGRSPNSIRSTAHHLKLYWEYLLERNLDWTNVDIEELAEFIAWLRMPRSEVSEEEVRTASRTNATID
ncbi:MAG: site-specific integrase [Ktedonobacterales bacterium]